LRLTSIYALKVMLISLVYVQMFILMSVWQKYSLDEWAFRPSTLNCSKRMHCLCCQWAQNMIMVQVHSFFKTIQSCFGCLFKFKKLRRMNSVWSNVCVIIFAYTGSCCSYCLQKRQFQSKEAQIVALLFNLILMAIVPNG